MTDQIGPYTIRDLLGEGGFSQVYRAYSPRRREMVALKLLHPAVTQSEEGRQRFLREVVVARRLRHRHVVPVYEAGIADGRAFLAMRLMGGGTLASRLNNTPVLDWNSAAKVMRHTAAALDHARHMGVVHRDIKPSNIFYYDDDRRLVCLGDFGLSKVRGLSTVTRPGEVIGSVYYMAPEQVRGLIYTTERSDVYSLGVVLYEMLTGRVPFRGQSQAGILHAIMTADPPRPRLYNDKITPEMERVIMRALSKQPERRPATAGALAAAFQSTLPARPRKSPAPQRARHPKGRGGVAARSVPTNVPTNVPTTQRPEFWIAILGMLALLLIILYVAG